MKLVVQCSLCGTNHPVGTTACATCMATGVQNLRLMFECPKCFHLGLTPECEQCNPPLPYEVVEEPEIADEFVPVLEVMDESPDPAADAVDDFEFKLDPDDFRDDDDFELIL